MARVESDSFDYMLSFALAKEGEQKEKTGLWSRNLQRNNLLHWEWYVLLCCLCVSHRYSWCTMTWYAGLRYVKPYYFTFTTHAKGRWVGSKVIDVFSQEFQSETPEFYVSVSLLWVYTPSHPLLLQCHVHVLFLDNRREPSRPVKSQVCHFGG